MAKLQNIIFIKNAKGQSAVEYILLLAVLSSVAFAFLNNKKFKDFIGGKGLFTSMRRGTEYSYRYGREWKSSIDIDEAMDFNYATNKHDTYYNKVENRSRFFSGTNPYGD